MLLLLFMWLSRWQWWQLLGSWSRLDQRLSTPLLLQAVSKVEEMAARANCSQRLPDVLIIGARKSGTRALLDMIAMNSKVVVAPQEVHFFDRESNYGRGLQWYRHQFPVACDDQVVLEKTPKYLVHPATPRRVFEMNPNILLILLVREPVERLVSDITQLSLKRVGLGLAPIQLPSAIFQMVGANRVFSNSSARWRLREKSTPVQVGVYQRHLRRWLRHFDRHRLLVLDSGALMNDPATTLARVEQHLHVPHEITRHNFYFNASKGFYCLRRGDRGVASGNSSRSGEAGSEDPLVSVKCLGSTKGQRHLQLPEPFRHRLRRYYAPHNAKLYRLVGEDFGWPVD